MPALSLSLSLSLAHTHTHTHALRRISIHTSKPVLSPNSGLGPDPGLGPIGARGPSLGCKGRRKCKANHTFKYTFPCFYHFGRSYSQHCKPFLSFIQPIPLEAGKSHARPPPIARGSSPTDKASTAPSCGRALFSLSFSNPIAFALPLYSKPPHKRLETNSIARCLLRRCVHNGRCFLRHNQLCLVVVTVIASHSHRPHPG